MRDLLPEWDCMRGQAGQVGRLSLPVFGPAQCETKFPFLVITTGFAAWSKSQRECHTLEQFFHISGPTFRLSIPESEADYNIITLRPLRRSFTASSCAI